MPGMTMVFKADEATIDTLSEGDTIEFIAHEVDGEITLTDVK
jgi:Cu/Ag efflux protein CusF|tara:strand:+ start:1762 stop:1887 length:126 start_codon:yes stop_codon:yes gene_type:complete